MKFESKAIEEHDEVPLADHGELENLVEQFRNRSARRRSELESGGGRDSGGGCYVVCVGDWLHEYSRDAQLSEIIGLVAAQGSQVVGSETVKQTQPDSATVLRSGKAKAAAERAASLGANMLVVDAELKPSQIRNLEDLAGMPVCDREAVILNVFLRHAKTRTARIQVEIAHLSYLKPLICGLGVEMDQQAGGIMGGRGPGETASELLARRLDKRLAELKKSLERVQVDGEAQRKRRSQCKRVALVGYTNAGKTTLMNQLASTELVARDMPFVTLDTTVRCLTRHGGDVLLSDTVGFIRRLPNRLLASFETTLAELREATLIVPVIDASDPEWQLHLEITHKMLVKLGAEAIPRYYVFSKADRLAKPPNKNVLDAIASGHDYQLISKQDRHAIGALKQTLIGLARADLSRTKVYVPYESSKAMETVYRSCRVLKMEAKPNGLLFCLEAESYVIDQIQRQRAEGRTMSQHLATLLKAENLDVFTHHGRQLFHDLNMEITRGQVAMIGRNGVGKTTLLKILAGETVRKEVTLNTPPHFVPQELDDASETIRLARDQFTGGELRDAGLSSAVLSQDTCSPGEQRKLHLLAARKSRSELLILDEPTSDLDQYGIDWLRDWLSQWSQGLLLVSHHRTLLSQFEHFYVIAESGCRYLPGGLTEVEKCLENEGIRKQRQYVRNLNDLIKKEEKNELVNNRHDRKKNRGRINELGRCPSRAKLNEKRSYAQVKQGRRKKLWRERISASRDWAKATRRALDVKLDLELIAPPQPIGKPRIIVDAKRVTSVIDGREIFAPVSICVQRADRIAVSGRNGAGKTTLLTILAAQRQADHGCVSADQSRIGMIEQAAANWKSDCGLAEHVQSVCDATLQDVAKILVGHRFPLGLAQRPLKSLSPGERVRAALICLYHRSPAIELLMLDEPTVGLDFVGQAALRDALKCWPGAIVVVSHDREFTKRIGVHREIELK